MADAAMLLLTADPDFLDLAWNELRQIASGATTVASPAPGLLLVACAEPFVDLAEQWRIAPPIFVRHICPVDATAELTAEPDNLELLKRLVVEQFMPVIDPELSFSVQTRIFGELPFRPFDLNNALAQTIHSVTGAPLDVRNPEQILSVVCVEATEPASGSTKRAYLGLSLAVHNLSNWAGGMRRFAREADQVSRSEFKLLEALEIFHVDLPPRGVALDLGASPGGWTRVLRQRGQYVTAVDPGDLDDRVAKDAGVRHKRMTAEAYLASGPDQFDLIVNDMRMDGRDSARLMVAYAPQLYPSGCALITLKLPTLQRRRVLEHAFKILSEVYRIAGARQLFHNRSEITLYLTKR